MKDTTISDSIFYVGADDTTLDLFESQYIVPEGVSYNSYVIMDDKITIMDTVDQRATEEWIANVKNVLKCCGKRRRRNFAGSTYASVFHGSDGALAGSYGNI